MSDDFRERAFRAAYESAEPTEPLEAIAERSLGIEQHLREMAQAEAGPPPVAPVADRRADIQRRALVAAQQSAGPNATPESIAMDAARIGLHLTDMEGVGRGAEPLTVESASEPYRQALGVSLPETDDAVQQQLAAWMTPPSQVDDPLAAQEEAWMQQNGASLAPNAHGNYAAGPDALLNYGLDDLGNPSPAAAPSPADAPTNAPGRGGSGAAGVPMPGMRLEQPASDAPDPIGDYYRTRSDVAGRRGDALGGAENDMADVLERYQQLQREAIDRFQENYEIQEAEEEQALLQVQDTTEELLNTEFDANRLFNNASGADRVGLAMGVAVGSVIQTMMNATFPGLNAPNMAKRMLDEAIERDITDQTQNYDQLRDGAASALSAFQAARQAGMDEREAELFLLTRQKEAAASELAVIGRRYRGENAGLVAEELSAQYAAEAEQLRQQLMAARLAAAASARRGRGRRSGGDEAQNVLMPPGYRTAEGRAEVKPTAANHRAVGTMLELQESQRLISRISQLTDDSGYFGRVAPGERAERISTNVALLMLQLKQATESGALDEGMLRIATSIIGDPASWTSFSPATARAKLQELSNSFRAREAGMASSLGLVRAENPQQPNNSPTIFEADAQATISSRNGGTRHSAHEQTLAAAGLAPSSGNRPPVTRDDLLALAAEESQPPAPEPAPAPSSGPRWEWE